MKILFGAPAASAGRRPVRACAPLDRHEAWGQVARRFGGYQRSSWAKRRPAQPDGSVAARLRLSRLWRARCSRQLDEFDLLLAMDRDHFTTRDKAPEGTWHKGTHVPELLPPGRPDDAPDPTTEGKGFDVVPDLLEDAVQGRPRRSARESGRKEVV